MKWIAKLARRAAQSFRSRRYAAREALGGAFDRFGRRASAGRASVKRLLVRRRMSDLWVESVLALSWVGVTGSVHGLIRIFGAWPVWPLWLLSFCLWLWLFEVGTDYTRGMAAASRRVLDTEDDALKGLEPGRRRRRP